MKRRIITTADGSQSIRIEEWDEQYHSKHGAVSESYHVFINNGLHHLKRNPLAILEMGFGTGLNALISLIEGKKADLNIHYTAVEAFPLKVNEWKNLNYAEALQADSFKKDFQLMHSGSWEEPVRITDSFLLTKLKTDMATFCASAAFDLVYFDAFGFRVQPELWTPAVFSNMFQSLNQGGILVTYAAKGSVRRALQEVGFTVERLEGPPGKREMLRAVK
ncbi:MAG: tRNA (5-methylaminomethyl-2-thiouridine)(34)-methyltransferase MnmD [Flavobacteriaceae bacterium]